MKLVLYNAVRLYQWESASGPPGYFPFTSLARYMFNFERYPYSRFIICHLVVLGHWGFYAGNNRHYAALYERFKRRVKRFKAIRDLKEREAAIMHAYCRCELEWNADWCSYYRFSFRDYADVCWDTIVNSVPRLRFCRNASRACLTVSIMMVAMDMMRRLTREGLETETFFTNANTTTSNFFGAQWHIVFTLVV